MIHVVSFSGGRTSAYLVHLMEQKRKEEGWDVRYVFMDTGAEHPKTYEFIRNLVNHWGIDLVCLRANIPQELGVGVKYFRCNIHTIKQDLRPWVDMLSKYGTPYNPGGAFCTNRMKTTPFRKYCNKHFGKGKYVTWLGIRVDEPKRLKPREGYRFLADIDGSEKEDILNWWSKQPFDLEIPEWLGNCVFCIKKGLNKVALASKEEPDQWRKFGEIIYSTGVRITDGESPPEEMYRGRNSPKSIDKLYADISREHLVDSMRGMKRTDTGSCSESCEIFEGED